MSVPEPTVLPLPIDDILRLVDRSTDAMAPEDAKEYLMALDNEVTRRLIAAARECMRVRE
jgi:hypothetical protein